MIFVDSRLLKKDLLKLRKDYIKLTVDLENEWIVADTELHADAEKMLLERGSKQDDIWGGGINLKDKVIDITAVLNLRPGVGNDSMELLDPVKRSKFEKIVKKYFNELWY